LKNNNIQYEPTALVPEVQEVPNTKSQVYTPTIEISSIPSHISTLSLIPTSIPPENIVEDENQKKENDNKDKFKTLSQNHNKIQKRKDNISKKEYVVSHTLSINYFYRSKITTTRTKSVRFQTIVTNTQPFNNFLPTV